MSTLFRFSYYFPESSFRSYLSMWNIGSIRSDNIPHRYEELDLSLSNMSEVWDDTVTMTDIVVEIEISGL